MRDDLVTRTPLASLRRFVLALLLVPLFAWPARATWSIVVVNTKTGEVAVASATCLNAQLENLVPVLVVGRGGGAAQASVDGNGASRRRMYDGFMAGWTPQEILDDLIENGSLPHTRQYGVAAFTGPAATHTGAGAGLAALGILGSTGDLYYAIQGNVLAGDEVVFAAETALTSTEGDLTQRVMAAMEAARVYGGDGRCSCSVFDPDGCGSPPPAFEKTAHSAFVYVARVGDTDGGCDFTGCAKGDYYLQIRNRGPETAPDPVLVLQTRYAEWRAALSGRPDHILSRVKVAAPLLPADGRTETSVRIGLVDIEGSRLTHGGAEVFVRRADANRSYTELSPVVDHGDGTYSLTAKAGIASGVDRLVITVDDGAGEVTLYPFPEIEVQPVEPLHAGDDAFSAGEGGVLPFVVHVPAAATGRYLILGSASGTDPGVVLGGVVLPLNPDAVTAFTLAHAGSAFFPGTTGALDADGRAEAALDLAPGFLAPLVGHRLDWAALTDATGLSVTNPVGFDVVP